MSSRFLEF